MSDSDDNSSCKLEPSTSLASSRSRRSATTSSKSSSRASALEKLREVREGRGKNKYEIREVENVYDVVDEGTYAKKVHERQRDDWIVDDGPGGYFEDGREIFDDDLNDHDSPSSSKKSKNSQNNKSKDKKKEKVLTKAEKEEVKTGFYNVRQMLSNMPEKRKRGDEGASEPAVKEDDLLNELMSELHNEKKSGKKPENFSTSSSFAQNSKKCRVDFESSFEDSDSSFTPIVPVKKELKKTLPQNYSAQQCAQNNEKIYEKASSYGQITHKNGDKNGSLCANSTAKKPQFYDDFMDGEFEKEPQKNSNSAKNGDKNEILSKNKEKNGSFIKRNEAKAKKVEIDSFDDDFMNNEDFTIEPDEEITSKKIEKIPERSVKNLTQPNFLLDGMIPSNVKTQISSTTNQKTASIPTANQKEGFSSIANQKRAFEVGANQKAAFEVGANKKRVFEVGAKEEGVWISNQKEGVDSDWGANERGDILGGANEKGLNFYWIDIVEETKNPGSLYVFGKIETDGGSYASVCLVLKGLTRCIYLLPRDNKLDSDEAVSIVDVYNEFNDVIATKFKINEFKSRPVKKKYCFDLPDVPPYGDYIEVRYSGTIPQLPSDLNGNTFSRVLGAGNPLLENFLLAKKLKGPGWVNVKNFSKVESNAQHSWCKFEFIAHERDFRISNELENKTPPPFTLVSLNVQAVNDAQSKKDSIVFIGVAIHKNFELSTPLKPNEVFNDHFCMINKPPGEIWPLDADERIFGRDKKYKVSKFESERALLACFLAKLQQIDPDLYVGHDPNFDILLLHLINLKVPHWSRLGRLKRSNAFGKQNKILDSKLCLSGRLLCDVKISAMELIRARSYDFPNLALQVLNTGVEVLSNSEIKELFERSEGLEFLVNWGMQHTVINIKLINELQVLPLALQITAIAGNTLFRTLLGGRSERNEYLLLHAFHAKDYIVPDKYRIMDKKEKEAKSTYAGGMVLDPKKGFYDNFIVLMDFNSLYPSIIQEFNICFTTKGVEEDKKDESRGILPEEIRKLVESRKMVKSLMKGSPPPHLARQYDIRQKALKLTANSMYGCLGFKYSRFYAQDLAALITGKGREILVRTKEAVERMGYEVIYGDTDSIMIHSATTELSKVHVIGQSIKTEINKMYRLLELEVDGIFRFLLLLKKKKYAALLYNVKGNGEVETVLELKGLDMVRRDWAPIASNTAKLALDEIMKEQSLDDKVFKIVKILEETATNLRTGNVVLKDLLITKQLTKRPEEYKEAAGLHHVTVALRMNKMGSLNKKFKHGDTVPYLFCTDGSPHHVSELSSSSNEITLSPDPQYYLAHQVHPVVSRICEPIDGLDAARIADALGIDSSSFRRKKTNGSGDGDGGEDRALGDASMAQKYQMCEKFSFKCFSCLNLITLTSPFNENSHVFVLNSCPHCSNSNLGKLVQIQNKLQIFIRNAISKYYKNVFVCEDPTCDNTTSVTPFSLVNGYPLCSRCNVGLMVKEISDSDLYRQLSYLLYIFDTPTHLESIGEMKDEMKSEEWKNGELGTAVLKALVARHIECSAYSEIKLSYLFQGIFPSKTINFFKTEPS